MQNILILPNKSSPMIYRFTVWFYVYSETCDEGEACEDFYIVFSMNQIGDYEMYLLCGDTSCRDIFRVSRC